MSDDRAAKRLSVDEAAHAAGVVPNTVRNWIKEGLLSAETDEGTTLIDHDVFVQAKLLRQVDLLSLPWVKGAAVSEADVIEATGAGIISPTAAPNRRYSIQDGRDVVAWKKGEMPLSRRSSGEDESVQQPANESQPEMAQPVGATGTTDRSGRWAMLREYITGHGDPAKLPPVFWETRRCPEFVPPLGVYRAWYGGLDFREEHGSVRVIARSPMWALTHGALVLEPESDDFDFEEWDADRERLALGEPPQHAEMNLRYRELRRTWDEAWYQRRRELAEAGLDVEGLPDTLSHEGRDRVRTVERYHRERWSPGDLPDWFFDTEECPPFIPPTGVFRFEYGKSELDPRTGQPRTWIRHSGGWADQVGEPRPVHVPADERSEAVAGVFPEGEVPAVHAEANLRYELAAQQWREEWRQRQRRRQAK